MGRSAFLYDNLIDAADLTASSEKTAFPVTNLQHRFLSRPWEAEGLDEYADADLGAAAQFDAVAIIGHNFTAATVITLHAADDDAFTVNVVSDTLDWADGLIFTALATRTKRYVELEIEDASSNPDGVVSVGRVIFGPAFYPARNFLRTGDFYVDRSEATRSAGGQKTSVIRERFRARSYRFPGVSDADKLAFDAMFAACGNVRAFVFCEDTDAPTPANSYYGTIAAYRVTPAVYGCWDIDITLEDEA